MKQLKRFEDVTMMTRPTVSRQRDAHYFHPIPGVATDQVNWAGGRRGVHLHRSQPVRRGEKQVTHEEKLLCVIIKQSHIRRRFCAFLLRKSCIWRNFCALLLSNLT